MYTYVYIHEIVNLNIHTPIVSSCLQCLFHSSPFSTQIVPMLLSCYVSIHMYEMSFKNSFFCMLTEKKLKIKSSLIVASFRSDYLVPAMCGKSTQDIIPTGSLPV